jgi:hypothetical protein
MILRPVCYCASDEDCLGSDGRGKRVSVSERTRQKAKVFRVGRAARQLRVLRQSQQQLAWTTRVRALSRFPALCTCRLHTTQFQPLLQGLLRNHFCDLSNPPHVPLPSVPSCQQRRVKEATALLHGAYSRGGDSDTSDNSRL